MHLVLDGGKLGKWETFGRSQEFCRQKEYFREFLSPPLQVSEDLLTVQKKAVLLLY